MRSCTRRVSNLGDRAGSVEVLPSVTTRSSFWEVLLGNIQNPDKTNSFEWMH